MSVEQVVRYEVRVAVSEEPLLDADDEAMVAAAIECAVDGLGWRGVSARAETMP